MMPLVISPQVGAALVSGGASLLGSLFGSKEASANTKATNEMNLQIARENNAWQERLQQQNNEWNRKTAIEMFNLENEYNSPAAQKARLVEAGLNPATMYGQGGQIGQGDIATPQAASSGVTPSMPSLQAPPSVLQGMFGNIETLSKAAGNIANAALTNSQRKKVELLMDSELDKILSDIALQDSKTQFQHLQNLFEREFGKINRQTELGLKVSQIWDNFQAACLKASQGDLAEAEKAYKDSMTALNSIEKEIKDQTKDVIIQQENQIFENLKKKGREIDAATEEHRAGAEEKRASAAYTEEQTSQLKDMRDDILAIKKAEAVNDAYEAAFTARTWISRVRTFIKGNKQQLQLNDREIVKLQNDIDYLQELAEKARKENSVFYMKLFADEADRVMSRMQNAASVASKLIK